MGEQPAGEWPYGASEMAGRIRAFAWDRTPLGPTHGWSPAVKAAVQLVLDSGTPMMLALSDRLFQIYNDALIPLAGAKHPDILGTALSETWPEAWSVNAPVYNAALRGEVVVVENMHVTLDRDGHREEAWFSASYSPFRDEGGAVGGVVVTVQETTDRVLVERARDELAARQGFLLRLTDALRPIDDPNEAQGIVAEMLGKELHVDRCYYAEFDWLRDVLHINREYVGSASFSVVGSHPISLFQDLLQFSHKGEPLVCDDIAEHPIFRSEVAAYRERGTDGFILVPMIKQGIMVACMCVTMATPRRWTAAEVELVREVGDRTWDAAQRARAEGAMRESEERFRQFASASSGALWIRDAGTLGMEYVSPAISRIYGVDADAFLGGVEVWASAIVPEDRAAALERLSQAAAGEAVVHEFRIQRRDDLSFRWIRSTDFPLRDERGRIQRIGGIAEDVTEAKQSSEHQAILLHELQHRVRNIMALIRSITTRTGERAESVAEYASLMVGRLMTFARVQALLTRAANAEVRIWSVVQEELAAQAQHDRQYEISGPDVFLSPKAAEVLTLAVHELTTNAVKYGGLSVPDGSVRVEWDVVERRGEPWLVFDWTGTGVRDRKELSSVTPRRRGFGSELIEGRIPYELGGSGKVAIGPDGACCHLEFLLTQGASILETDAPRRATVFGGAIDMTGQPDLRGQTVLVLEDDYYLAVDTARALQGAGANVLGPFATENAARAEIGETIPTGAVLDINLGGMLSFAVAEVLLERGIPFVFVTGHDDRVIPPAFEAVPRLQKPVDLRQVVGTLADAMPDADP